MFLGIKTTAERVYRNFSRGCLGKREVKLEYLLLGERCIGFLCLATSLSTDVSCSFERDIFILVLTSQKDVKPFEVLALRQGFGKLVFHTLIFD